MVPLIEVVPNEKRMRNRTYDKAKQVKDRAERCEVSVHSDR